MFFEYKLITLHEGDRKMMISELPACMLLLTLLSGVRSTFFFVDLEGRQNFSQSSEHCANIIRIDEKNAFAKTDLHNLIPCSNQLDVNGVYWMKYETGMTYPVEPSAWQCTFETENPCFLVDKTSGRFKWTRNQGATSSSDTGPDQAYEGSFYMYIEASWVPEGQPFELRSDILPESELCLLFHYHMVGSNIGKLMIILYSDVDVILWDQKEETEMQKWFSQSVDINPNNSKSMIRIIAVRGNGRQGDIALDYVRLKYGRCEKYQHLLNKVCGDTEYSESGVITSANYPLPYQSNSNCTWEIVFPEDKFVYLHINDLQLEERKFGKGCYDSLEIIDDINDEQLAFGCRQDQFNASYQMFTRSLKLRFVSDVDTELRGFNITWTTVTESCPAVKITRGDISPVLIPCEEELNRVICFSDPIPDPDPACRLYPSETTLAFTTSDRQYHTSDHAMTKITGVTDGNSQYQKPLPTKNSTIIAAVIGIIVGTAVFVAVIVSVVCYRRRRASCYRKESYHTSRHGRGTFEDKLHNSNTRNNTVLNPEYSFQAFHNVIQNVTNEENSYVILEKEQTKRENEVTRGTTKQSVKRTYENTTFVRDATYNHLNEAVAEKGPNTYSRFNDLNSYDHLSPGIREIAESDTYDHAVKDESIGLENMGKSASNESDYINTVVPKNSGDTIYEFAH